MPTISEPSVLACRLPLVALMAKALKVRLVVEEFWLPAVRDDVVSSVGRKNPLVPCVASRGTASLWILVSHLGIAPSPYT